MKTLDNSRDVWDVMTGRIGTSSYCIVVRRRHEDGEWTVEVKAETHALLKQVLRTFPVVNRESDTSMFLRLVDYLNDNGFEVLSKPERSERLVGRPPLDAEIYYTYNHGNCTLYVKADVETRNRLNVELVTLDNSQQICLFNVTVDDKDYPLFFGELIHLINVNKELFDTWPRMALERILKSYKSKMHDRGDSGVPMYGPKKELADAGPEIIYIGNQDSSPTVVLERLPTNELQLTVTGENEMKRSQLSIDRNLHDFVVQVTEQVVACVNSVGAGDIREAHRYIEDQIIKSIQVQSNVDVTTHPDYLPIRDKIRNKLSNDVHTPLTLIVNKVGRITLEEFDHDYNIAKVSVSSTEPDTFLSNLPTEVDKEEFSKFIDSVLEWDGNVTGKTGWV